MVIQSRSPLALPSPVRVARTPDAPTETFTRQDDDEEGLSRPEVMRVACTVLGAGAGAYAGLANGILAGVLGAAATALPAGILGAVAAEKAGELCHASESLQAGLALGGGALGLVGGAVAGYLVGAQCNSPVLAVGMAVLGAGSAIFRQQ